MKIIQSYTGMASLIALTLTALSQSARSQDGPILPRQPPQPTEPQYGDYPNTTITFPLTEKQLPTPLPGQPKLVIPGPNSELPTKVVQITPAKKGDPNPGKGKGTLTAEAAKELTLFWNQQAFDIFAWQSFIALNRAADPKKYGKPSSTPLGKAAGSDRVWETFIPPRLVFRKGAATPKPYQPASGTHPNDAHSVTKRTHLLNEVDEAFFNLEKPLPPILDTHREYVRYEIRLNKPEYDYIVSGPKLKGKDYPLYSIAGQMDFIEKGGTINLPPGSIELKVGWKKLTDKEKDSKRFFAQELEVYENPYAIPPKEVSGTYGMVAMHIMYLVDGIPQWVWPTFEHVDNGPVSDLRGGVSLEDHIGNWGWTGKDGSRSWTRTDFGPNQQFSFFDPTKKPSLITSIGGYSPASLQAMKTANAIYSTGLDNYYQYKEARTITIPARVPSQITKVITDNNAIAASKWTQALNEAVQKNLEKTGPWKNYRLVSTQWPSTGGLTAKWQTYIKKYNEAIKAWNDANPSDQMDFHGPLGGGTIRAGNPAPISLGNAGAETYMQINGSCMNCHAGATLNFPYPSGSPFAGSKPDADFTFMLQRAQ